jgi:uncharacterized protein YciI
MIVSGRDGRISWCAAKHVAERAGLPSDDRIDRAPPQRLSAAEGELMYFMSVNRLAAHTNAAQIGAVLGAHVAWTKRLIAAGTLVQAGRFGDDGGMAIIKASDRAEAEAVQATDPLVTSGAVTYQLAALYPDVPLE